MKEQIKVITHTLQLRSTSFRCITHIFMQIAVSYKQKHPVFFSNNNQALTT